MIAPHCPRTRYLRELPSSEIDGSWRSHATGCLACRATLDDQATLTSMVRTQAGASWSHDDHMRLRHRLLKAAAGRSTPIVRHRRKWVRAVAFALLSAASGAAAAMGGRAILRNFGVIGRSQQMAGQEASRSRVVAGSRQDHAPLAATSLARAAASVTADNSSRVLGGPGAGFDSGATVAGEGLPAVGPNRGTGPHVSAPVAAAPPGTGVVADLHRRLIARSGASSRVALSATERQAVNRRAEEKESPRAMVPDENSSVAEREFADGWQSLRSGDQVRAVERFAAAAAAEPRGQIGEDARYWQAVVLGRLGRKGEAREALERFLTSFSRSPRAGEIRVMLGWNLLAAGDPASAVRLFKSSTDDPSARVRQSAQAGLATAHAP